MRRPCSMFIIYGAACNTGGGSAIGKHVFDILQDTLHDNASTGAPSSGRGTKAPRPGRSHERERERERGGGLGGAGRAASCESSVAGSSCG